MVVGKVGFFCLFVLIVDMRKRIVREILDYPDQEENL